MNQWESFSAKKNTKEIDNVKNHKREYIIYRERSTVMMTKKVAETSVRKMQDTWKSEQDWLTIKT